jgi:hypothetical protein
MCTALQSFLAATALSALLSQSPVSEKGRAAVALQKIRSAQTVYFDDQTRSGTKTGDQALAELKKWGRYKIVEDRTQADLILLFSLEQV